MAEILDLIAKVSWQTNQAELDKLNKAIDKQDDALTELIRKGQRLEQQRAKTDNPAKVKELNKAMEANKKAIDSLTKATENQGKATLDLVNKQKQLAKAIAESTDPKQASRLLAEFKKLEQQIKTTEKSAGGLVGSFGNIGQSIMGGLGLGVGSMGLESLVSGISSFVSSANQEFIDAENTTLRFKNTLKGLGQEQYFDELTAEADMLAKQIGYLDNDDIVSAQEKMLTYGKLSKNEISQLLPVIIDLAARMGTDVPSATETMINIMEGRGGQTLRQLGLTIKDANTTTERLGVIFEELGPKIAGSAESVKNSSDGMRKVLNQQIADLEESVGASTIKLQNYFLGAYAGFLKLLKKLAQSEGDARKEEQDKYRQEQDAAAQKLTDRELELEKSLLATKIQNRKDAQDRIWKLEAENAKTGLQYIGRLEINENNKKIQADRDFMARQEAEMLAIINESNNRSQRQAEDAALKAKRDAEDKANAEKEAGKKSADRAKEQADKKIQIENDLIKQLEADRLKLDEFLLTADEKEMMALTRRYDEQMGMAEGNYKLQMLARENYLDALLHLQRKHEFEMDSLGSVSLEGTKKAEKEKVDLTKNTAYQAMATRVADAQDAIKKQEEDKARKAKERQDLFDATMAAAQAAQSLISIEQEKNDRLIGLQQERIEAARDSASSSLKIEEDRLNELLEKRQKYERAQRTIDAAVIVANQAVAISQAIKAITTSSTLGPAGIAANVIAIIAGLAASIAAVRGATADIPAFREGGYTGDGNPDNVSTTLGARPYVYHKKEFVMDEELTSKHRDLFEGLHKRDMVVKKLDDGQFYVTRNGLDTTKLVDDHISIKNQMQTDSIVYQLSAINERLSQREVSITNTFDSNGFGNVIATQLGRIEINKKLR
jgi:hypothetical protein